MTKDEGRDSPVWVTFTGANCLPMGVGEVEVMTGIKFHTEMTIGFFRKPWKINVLNQKTPDDGNSGC